MGCSCARQFTTDADDTENRKQLPQESRPESTPEVLSSPISSNSLNTENPHLTGASRSTTYTINKDSQSNTTPTGNPQLTNSTRSSTNTINEDPQLYVAPTTVASRSSTYTINKNSQSNTTPTGNPQLTNSTRSSTNTINEDPQLNAAPTTVASRSSTVASRSSTAASRSSTSNESTAVSTTSQDNENLITTDSSTSYISADFLKTDQMVPPAYQTFASIFLQNEFPKLNVDFIISKLEENNFHIYPVFKFIFKKYWLCDCVLHPEDEDGETIYELENEVKENYSDKNSTTQGLDSKQREAVRAYPLLANELQHISVKRQSYRIKVAAVKALIYERRRILNRYADQKRRSLETDVPYPLTECPACSNHYLERELSFCSSERHIVCRYCLRSEIITNYISKGKSEVVCMVEKDCKGTYTLDAIRTALGAKKYQNYENMMDQNGLNIIEGPNVHRCPFCPWRYISEIKPETFSCKRCHKVTCFLCNKEVKTHPNGICPKKKEEEDESLNYAMSLLHQVQQAEQERQRQIAQNNEDGEAYAKSLLQQLQLEEKDRAAEEQRQREAQERRDAERRRQQEVAAAAEKRRREEEERKEREKCQGLFSVYVENAMNEALVRTCPGPNCRKKTVKDGGCNHMNCKLCGCQWCYVCNKACEDQINYGTHFSNSGCPWYFSNTADQAASDAKVNQKLRQEAQTRAAAEWYRLNPNAPRSLTLPVV